MEVPALKQRQFDGAESLCEIAQGRFPMVGRDSVLRMRAKVALLGQFCQKPGEIEILLQNSGLAEAGFCSPDLPRSPADSSWQVLYTSVTDAIIVGLAAEQPTAGIRCVELLVSTLPQIPVIAVGDLNKPELVVLAMRAGARDFLARPLATPALRESLLRLLRPNATAGKIWTVINAKGGSGATTVAVNLAMVLAAADKKVALIDMAIPGNAILHLQVQPRYTLNDALQSLERLDSCLLDDLMEHCHCGLSLLAGAPTPLNAVRGEDVIRLLDFLAREYEYLVVDASTRLDAATAAAASVSESVLMVMQPELASIWNASKVAGYLRQSARENIKIVLNRERKIAGFSEAELEKTVGSKIVGRIPGHYHAVTDSIERATPLVLQRNSALAKSFLELAAAVTGIESTEESGVKPSRRVGLASLRAIAASK
jgi:pilus assembly protein CpaE